MRRRLLTAAAIPAFAIALFTSPARAGAPTVPTVDPTEGLPGTEVAVFLEFCDTGSASARVELLAPGGDVVLDTGFVVPSSEPGFPVHVHIEIPSVDPGTYTVRATCNNQPPGDQTGTTTFEVLGDDVVVEPPPVDAPAAIPTGVGPTFTG